MKKESGEKKGRRARGSVTIEAALALPLFLFFFVAMMNFLLIVSLQSDIQLAMEETARSIGKTAYLYDRVDSVLTSEQTDADTASILSTGINSLTIKTTLLKNGLSERLNKSRVTGGAGGLYTYHSSFDADSGILDIIVNYTYRIPYLPKDLGTLRFVQRCRSHVWTGKLLRESGGSGDGKEKAETVYVTPNGTAYHTSLQCSYLDLSIRQVSRSEVDAERNLNGGKYYKCPTCGAAGSGAVYITNYGTNWHSSISCPGLKRTIETVQISEIGDRHLCPKCGVEH